MRIVTNVSTPLAVAGLLLTVAPAATAAAPQTAAASRSDARTIRMPRDPQISPDGGTIAFAWRGDVWTAQSSGGDATRLTSHPADDADPFFSPDGEWVAFMSSRSGGRQIHLIPAAGGTPAKQLTFDSQRKTLWGFAPDGKTLLVTESTDRAFHYSETARLFAVDLAGDAPKRMLLDVGLNQPALSPDGKSLLFVRGRPMWNRKGYSGSQAAQLWHADLTTTPPTLTRADSDRTRFQNTASTHPMWAPDGQAFYFVADPDGCYEIFRGKIGGKQAQQITKLANLPGNVDDGVAYPSMSSDGKKLLFRWRFDLRLLDLATGKIAEVPLRATGDAVADPLARLSEENATAVAFTDDGKQMAFVAGEDVWVMDRILKEPVRVTSTPHNETSLAFSSDGSRLFFVSDHEGEFDIYSVTHKQEDGIWWLAQNFDIERVTDDRAVESSLRPSPAGGHIAYHKGTDLFVMDDDGDDHRRILETWSRPEFDWSPDGKWFVYATQDSNYNPDVWIAPLDGTRRPFNLSRHPDRDGSPAWSGDGKRIAFVGRRDGEEADIYYVELTDEEAETTSRDRRMKKALAAMKKGKKSAKKKTDKKDANKTDAAKGETAKTAKTKKKGDKDIPDVAIDFDGILDRIQRIRISDSYERGLIWSPDGKTLAFSATVRSDRGIYAVSFPDRGAPKKLASGFVTDARWLRKTNEIVGRSSSKPAAMSSKGKLETFGFNLRRTRDWSAMRQIAFDQGWRAMRDRFYDPAMNNRDWDAIRAKYRPVAAQCLGRSEFSELMNMMLGELNASHMGHRGGADPMPSIERANAWQPTTYQLGLRFANPTAVAKSFVVDSVIPGSPCDRERSRVKAGETLIAIDGVKLGPTTDLDRLMTMDDVRDVTLTIAGREGGEREVTVRPSRSVAGLVYDEWVETCRSGVEEMSEGKLGYLHIRGMNMSSFRQMEEDLYHAGSGKDGLIIDVRFNGGGSTTDHVLTALTQPRHAITKSRGSGEGYPQDRKIYASWQKPIVLMCNEHSFSNAEILAHAIKQIGRGRVVGMRTAGGVISTGSARLLDGSSVRMPTRGWYLVNTGEDMELNGCEPDIALWNPPGGEDLQLEAAVKALQEDVAAEQARGRVKIEPAATKRRRARATPPVEASNSTPQKQR